MLKRALLVAALLGAASAVADPARAATAAVHRVLFDNSKAETAGNADWIISTAQPDPLAQNGNPTGETSWTGALSSWGVALQRTGQYSLKTLPPGNPITYGGSSSLDLANFDEFVMPEPNSPLSAAEKTAIMRFIQAGGAFFLIVDHTGSDRNSDGWDSVRIANDLLTNNGVDNTDPFGFSVDADNIANENPVAINSTTDPVINGPFGRVRGSILRNGSTQTLHPADNPAVKGLVFRSGSTTAAEFTVSAFGQGKVAVWGDSSAIDDGTGQSGNTLFDGWNDPGGTDAALALNATAWLAGAGPTGGTCQGGQLFGNPGFETGTAAPWQATSGVISNATAEPAHTGSWKAWLDGYGAAHTDTLAQSYTLPAGCTRATLSFWLHVDTAETGSTAFDKLTVTAGGQTVATYSNVDAAAGYQSKTLTVNGSGTVTFTGVEGSKLATSFVLDDITLSATA